MNHLGPSIFIGTVLLFSCSMSARGNNRNHSAAPRYRFEITDSSDEKRFVLSLKSLDDRPLCIYVEKWPNGKGQLHFGSTWVKLKSAEGTYPARDENFGYCIDEHGKPCLIRIAPRSAGLDSRQLLGISGADARKVAIAGDRWARSPPRNTLIRSTTFRMTGAAPSDRIWECECYCVVFCRCRLFV
jgi:hypothetical protein